MRDGGGSGGGAEWDTEWAGIGMGPGGAKDRPDMEQGNLSTRAG